MAVSVTAESPDTAEVNALIGELDALLEPLYPRESRHGLSVDLLISEAVAFFVLRVDGAPAGCVGIQLVGTRYGEIKRLYVRPQFRGRGLSRVLLNRVEDHSRTNGVHLVRLETGILQKEAIALYERTGYRRIPPFGAYTEDPLSLCYEKRLE